VFPVSFRDDDGIRKQSIDCKRFYVYLLNKCLEYFCHFRISHGNEIVELIEVLKFFSYIRNKLYVHAFLQLQT